MKKFKEIISFVLLVLFYLLCSFRYFPDRWAESLVETAIHLLQVAPFLIGAIIIIDSIMHKMSGERLPWINKSRIFLTLGLIVELFIGMSNYWTQNLPG
ncbi:MAG: hypothetical protein KKB30_16120 [Proteobacteria bacterium]|nr:hypothetical protein [Pseudomonadota bacterium]MBU1713977.1 hypothetical protein [Pseudomonadota bacterium]